MRYPAERKAQTHEKILAAAARSFREHGSEINGIGQVIKELGLTKGGFYRHFREQGRSLRSSGHASFRGVRRPIGGSCGSCPEEHGAAGGDRGLSQRKAPE